MTTTTQSMWTVSAIGHCVNCTDCLALADGAIAAATTLGTTKHTLAGRGMHSITVVKAPVILPEVILVYSRSLGDEDGNGGGAPEDIAVYTDPNVALAAATERSNEYGGHKGRPEMHMDTVKISTKTRGW